MFGIGGGLASVLGGFMEFNMESGCCAGKDGGFNAISMTGGCDTAVSTEIIDTSAASASIPSQNSSFSDISVEDF